MGCGFGRKQPVGGMYMFNQLGGENIQKLSVYSVNAFIFNKYALKCLRLLRVEVQNPSINATIDRFFREGCGP